MLQSYSGLLQCILTSTLGDASCREDDSLYDGLDKGYYAAEGIAPVFERDNHQAAVRFLVAYLRGQRDYFHAINKKDEDSL